MPGDLQNAILQWLASNPRSALMPEKKYAEIQADLADERLASLPPLNIAVLRNVTLEAIEPYLEHLGAAMDFRAAVKFGDYDNVYQEAVGGRPDLLNRQTDCVLVVTALDNLSWPLARNYAALSPEQRRSEIERGGDFIRQTTAGIRQQTDAMILWFGFEQPVNPALGIADSQSDSGQLAAVAELNDILRTALRQAQNAWFVDTNLCLARIGSGSFYDPRYWHIGRAPYAREGLGAMAEEAFKYIRALKGKARKCLVLDCDNVLWGGIVGEDGLAGIKLGKTYPGSPYYEFQQEVLNLYHRGILLAICSKNNEQDVREVLDHHPDMLLRREHFAATKINWTDKASNLRQIASELNIAPESLVFVDDSEMEIGLVRSLLPEVAALHLPAGNAVMFRGILAGCGLFDSPILSGEDSRRGAMYAAEALREDLRVKTADLDQYYASLEMRLEIRFADDLTLPRIAQLTQKTNQFNLTTQRYSELDIRRFQESPEADVISLRLVDRFGDSGIVGVAILAYRDGTAAIDSFLLSCRVLGRKVEDALLSQCAELARSRGCRCLIGEYRATAKNSQTRDFYTAHGFFPLESGSGSRFKLDLAAAHVPCPHVFAEVQSEIQSVMAEEAAQGRAS